MTKKNILFMQNILLFIFIILLLLIGLSMLSKNTGTSDVLNHKFNISSYANLGHPSIPCNNGDVLFNAYTPAAVFRLPVELKFKALVPKAVL